MADNFPDVATVTKKGWYLFLKRYFARDKGKDDARY